MNNIIKWVKSINKPIVRENIFSNKPCPWESKFIPTDVLNEAQMLKDHYGTSVVEVIVIWVNNKWIYGHPAIRDTYDEAALLPNQAIIEF